MKTSCNLMFWNHEGFEFLWVLAVVQKCLQCEQQPAGAGNWSPHSQAIGTGLLLGRCLWEIRGDVFSLLCCAQVGMAHSTIWCVFQPLQGSFLYPCVLPHKDFSVAQTKGCVNIRATENAKALFPVSISGSALEEHLVPDQLGSGAGCCPPAQGELHRQSQ